MSSATGNRYLVGRMGGVRVLVNNRREGHADASSVGGLCCQFPLLEFVPG